jgi:cytolysin-activating lysine-acyltransferase
MLDHIIHLLAQSPFHKSYDAVQISRCIIPPYNLGQHTWITENGYIVAWVSWGFISEEKSAKFLDGQYKIHPDDWRSGNVLIVMDFVAPFGHAKKLIKKCRSLFPPDQKAKWRRHSKNRRVEVTFHA